MILKSKDQLASEAVDLLKRGKKSPSQKAAAVESAAREALTLFIRQEPEFAEAVIAKDNGTGEGFAGCLEYIVKNCGFCLSDITAYRRAVEYYFPGAGVHFTMTVNLCASVDGSGDNNANVAMAERATSEIAGAMARNAEEDDTDEAPEAEEPDDLAADEKPKLQPTVRLDIDISDLFE